MSFLSRRLHTLALAVVLGLAAALTAPSTSALAATFRSPYFTMELPKGWDLVNGPFKKRGGETAVIGRKDHKASIQILSGPIEPDRFKDVVKGYAQSLKVPVPPVRGQQAAFPATYKGQSLYIIFRCDNTKTKLAIFICNGNMKDMQFIYRNIRPTVAGMKPQP